MLISTSPVMSGCNRGDAEQSATPAAEVQPSVTPAAAPTAPASAIAPEQPGPAPGAATRQELEELVSPIALYPDVLVAQILAASTYPAQIVEAERWLKANPNLTGDQLAASVNSQPWDPSVKSLTQFPSVLQTMSDSLAWTSVLGEAYYNQPAGVMNAIQALRNMALNAGTLKSTPQQTVEVQTAPSVAQNGEQPSVQQTVIIQPAQPNTVYVPQYNPTTAYGAPVPAPAGYSGSDLLLTGVLAFGAGILVGTLINDGHNNWGCNWGGSSSSVVYNKNIYVSNSNVLPARYPKAGYPNNGYPRPGYKPPNAGYPRPGNPPSPYPGGRPHNEAIPATRPYNPANAKPYAAVGNNPSRPNFPKAETLAGNSTNTKTREAQPKRPAQPAKPAATTRPATAKPINRVPANPANDPARGYGKGPGSNGGRNSALGGGYEPGGSAQAASNRGHASVSGNPNAAGGRREGPKGGANGGGGNRERGSGGGGKRGGRKGQ